MNWYDHHFVKETDLQKQYSFTLESLVLINNRFRSIWVLGHKEKKKEIWLSPVTKSPIPTENSKTKGQHKNATKNVYYTTIADRLRTVSWGNDSNPTGVVKPVHGYPIFPLTAKAV